MSVCPSVHESKNEYETGEKSTLGYDATQCFDILGHEDTSICGNYLILIRPLLAAFATNIIIIITRNEDKITLGYELETLAQDSLS